MKTTISLVILTLGLANAQQQAYHQQQFSGHFGLRIPNENRQTSAPAEYNYSYDVRDDVTGDRKSQEESRSGDRVRGRYSLLDADGSTRTVEYSVDSDSGFNAVVRRDGDQITLPETNSRPVANNPNGYQRTSAPEVFRNRYQSERSMQSNARTRLAQDSRTGNVVDLHSGFGAAPQTRSRVLPTPVPRTQPVNSEYFDNVRPEQERTEVYDTQGNQNLGDIQEILARSQYHISHPLNHHLSTAPVHFPLFRSVHSSRSGLIAPSAHVDVRRPTPLFADSNNSDRESNNNAQNPEQTSEINAFHQNVQYPVQQEEVRGPTTPAPAQSTFRPVPQEVYPASNNTRAAPFGTRLDVTHHPEQTVSVQRDSVITDTVGLTQNTVYQETGLSTPAPLQNYQDVARIPSDRSNDNAQRYLYPASTLPLPADSPAHFFTGDHHLTNGIAPLITDFGVRNSIYDHLVPTYHFTEPIPHNIHVLH